MGSYSPFVWYGTGTGPWFRLLRSNRREITLNRLINIAGVSLLAPTESIVSFASEVAFGREADATEVVPPLFVLGHWRSGTTFLHNLLACDPGHAFPTTLQCLFPGSFLITQHTLGWLVSALLPAKRPMDDVPLGRDTPFEDEFALAKLGVASTYAGLAAPGRPPNLDHLDLIGLPLEQRAAWEETVLRFMRRLQFANPGKRLVLKSPPHTARIATLLKLFPEARFIHITRNPFEIYPSTINLWKVLNSRQGFANPARDDEWLPDYVLAALRRMYAAYDRDLPTLRPGQLAELRYEEFTPDPIGALARIYDRLALGDFAPARCGIERYLPMLGEHKGAHWRLTEAERATIAGRWQGYFDRFGYDAASGRPF